MKRSYLAMSCLLAISGDAFGCLWDYDTLKQERARFPDALEIITGKFLRHSKEFYEWRIQDRLAKLAVDPANPHLYDDLAVAYFKTGQNSKAIETMQTLDGLVPDRYETNANLSVFYFVANDLKKALAYVNKALEINPNAHFGREKYQKFLTEYVIQQRRGGKIELPLNRPGNYRPPGEFSRFLTERLHPSDEKKLTKAEYQEAVQGVLGMMRFAAYDSPILLEVLGDLLIGQEGFGRQREIDAKQLAARAFLHASRCVADLKSQESYVADAARCVSLQQPDRKLGGRDFFETLESAFAQELEEAARWYEDLHAREIGWIHDGLNPEEEFDRLYANEPRISGEISKDDAYPGEPFDLLSGRIWWVIGGGAILLSVGAVLVLRWLVRKFRIHRASHHQAI